MERFYFDHNATTPVAPEVVEALLPVFTEHYGNASSIHGHGQAARGLLESARAQAGALMGAHAGEVVFTSGGTEADNLALFGAVRASARPRKHVVTTAIEHPAVLNACGQLEREGAEVSYVRVGGQGVVDPDDIRRALRPGTVLVSMMHANNELGAIQPLEEVARIARQAGVLMHSDGVQAAGKIPIDVARLGVDLYSISGHKMYAPKGVGVLFVRDGAELAPLLFGGRHERGRRPGTENVPGAVAFGRAADLARERLETEAARLAALRDRLERGVLERVPGTRINSAGAPRTPNTTNIQFDGVDGEAMVIALDLRGFAVSSGAACSSGATEPSHVLSALGLSHEGARSSLRFSLGRSNTGEAVERLIDAVAAAARQLRSVSATYSGHV